MLSLFREYDITEAASRSKGRFPLSFQPMREERRGIDLIRIGTVFLGTQECAGSWCAEVDETFAETPS